MPLAVFRGRPSLRDLRGGEDKSDMRGSTSAGEESIDIPRPQSMRASTNTTPWPNSFEKSSASDARPVTPSGLAQKFAKRRSSLHRLRYASDPQLSSRFRHDQSTSGSSTPPGAPAPVIGITAPTWEMESEKPKKKFNLFTSKPSSFKSKSENLSTGPVDQSASSKKTPFMSRKSTTGSSSMEQSPSPALSINGVAHTPQAGGGNSLSVPQSRVSASSLSDQASESQVALAGKGPPRTASSTSSNFFKLPKKKKKRKQESLFPLPVELSPSQPTGVDPSTESPTIIPVPPSSASVSRSNPSPASTSPQNPSHRSAGSHGTPPISTPQASSHAPEGLATQPSTVSLPFGSSRMNRQDSTTSAPIPRSTPAINTTVDKTFRGRSGTTTSFSSRVDDDRAPTPFHESIGRSSMASTTLGRNSVAGLRSLTSRWRNPSESHSPGVNSPGGLTSKNNSFALSKETLVLPERGDGETAVKFYNRLEKDMPKKSIALCLSKSSDTFHSDVLRSLLRTFKFYEEPMDISLRKFLWEIDLQGEAQQIDRVICAFAERYHECNPHIFLDFDQAYLAAYSLIILHSDLFNKNNKRKMQRLEYQKNTGGHGIDEEILGYFYDNIQYTEFIAQTLDDDESDRKSKKSKARKRVRKIKVANAEAGERGKLDPYDFILDDRLKLEVLRPALRGAMNLDDTFSPLGTAFAINIRKIRDAFLYPGILQVISARSRPEAFSSPATIDNPLEAHVGVVDIKVGKVGFIWRKDPKKKKGRSPWQKWGALLTQSQLYFFRNVAWVEDLIKQSEAPQKQGLKHSVVVFRPQIEEFKPDFSLRTAAALALVDSTYDKHKHGFVLASYDGFSDETVLADSENEMNDWLAKINYSSAFACANIAMCPVHAPARDPLHKTDTSSTSRSQSTAVASDEVNESPVIRQINVARKEAVRLRINQSEANMRECQQKLDENLKTARHLQILAPFPPKTRSDLLAFGARMAHRVRWSRFDMCRLKCHKDILAADLEYHERPQESSTSANAMSIKPVSPKTSSKANALSRLNSKASAIINPQRGSKLSMSQNRPSAASKLGTAYETELASGMDHAFATPAEAISKGNSSSESPFKLPPLTMGSGAISVSSMEMDRPENSVLGDSVRNNSTISEGSVAQPSEAATTPTRSVTGHEDVSTIEKRPSTAVEAEREPTLSGTPGRNNVRRSLNRTLRESREMGSQQRSRKFRDSVSTINHDDSGSREEKETIPRGAGSFKVHGKKASVITLGSEWQGMSAEERLRLRKQAQMAQEAKAEVSPVVEADGDVSEQMMRLSKDWEENNSFQSAIESAAIAETDGELVAYGPTTPGYEDAVSQLSSDVPLEESAVEGEGPGPALTAESWSEDVTSSDEGSSIAEEEDVSAAAGQREIAA